MKITIPIPYLIFFISAEPIFMCGDHCLAVVPSSGQDARLNGANGTICVSSTQF